MARESATHVLVPILVKMGYREEDITITFRKDFTESDMPMILENTIIENDRQ